MKAMTLTEQIHAILEHKGYRLENNRRYGLDQKLHDSWSLGIDGDREIPLPKLLDRQICWEVFEKDIQQESIEGQANYRDNLFIAVGLTTLYILDENQIYPADQFLRVALATPEQRIEAYVRHIGKWRD